MKLYEINAEMEALLEQIYECEDQLTFMLTQVDKATGEPLCDPMELNDLNALHDRLIQELEELSISRDEKLESMALYVKNAEAEAKAIRDEEKALAERRKSLENRAGRTRSRLENELSGEKISTPRVAVSYRKSTAVELDPDFLATADMWWQRVKAEPDKEKITKALKAGETVPGAKLVERINMTIK